MKILFVGDVFGEVGKKALLQKIPEYKRREGVDFVIANGENVTQGKGIKIKEAEELFRGGVNVITSGNHAFDQEEIRDFFKREPRLLHPANYSRHAPSKGWVVQEVYSGVRVAVLNLMGRIEMLPSNCPFEKAEELLEELQGQTDCIVVDMHAEATSESRAMGWFLDGKVAAVLGTHRHVQTADEEILPGGTAYITDTGMTGPYHSIIGMKIEGPLQKFRTGMRKKYEPAKTDVRFCAVLVEVEESTGRARTIKRIQERMGETV